MYTGILPEQGPNLSVPLRFYVLGNLNLLIALIGFAIKFYVLKEISFTIEFLFYNKTFLFFLHLFTIGYLLFIIFGSLFQIFSVVIGIKVKKPELIANLIILFFYSILFFFYQIEIQFHYSPYILLPLVGLFFIIFVFFFLPLMQNIQLNNIGFLYSILSFLLGILLIFTYFLILLNFLEVNINLNKITLYHSLFMFIGFIFQLIASMFFQILPLFYVTKPYPKKIALFINFFYFFGILLYIVLEISFSIKIYYTKILFSIGNLIFIYSTLQILLKRERKIQDITIYFFYLGMICLILSNFLLLLEIPFLYPFVFFCLFVVAIISGMHYKIIPFLCWFHLQSLKNQIKIKNPKFLMKTIAITMQDFTFKKIEKLHLFVYVVILVVVWIPYMFSLYLEIFLSFLFFSITWFQILYAIIKYTCYYKKIEL